MNYFSMLLITLALLLTTPGHALEAPAQTHEHIKVRLVSEQSRATAGGSLTLALVLEHEPHWHTYWQFPGDSGLPTTLKLKFDEGDWQPAQLQWPVPQPLNVGGIHNVGYEGVAWLLTDVRLPSPLPKTLHAQTTWLVCEEICIPGKATFALALTEASGAAPVDSERLTEFAKARDALPKIAPSTWRVRYAHDEKAKTVVFSLDGDLAVLGEGEQSLFVGSDTLAAIAPSPLSFSGGQLQTRRPQHEAFDGAPETLPLLWVVQTEGARMGFQTVATRVDATALTALVPTPPAAPSANIGFAWALLLAFGGGVILNLMPCVLPVLSIKILGLLASGPGAIRAHALAYSAGVITSFLLLGVVLLTLRQAGTALGWGFQLQSPALVGALSLLMFVMALSMSGLVHFGYGMAGLEDRVVGRHSGHTGAFLTGVLACVVASPCTAPMMGSALGYALVQPPVESLSVLMALGLGLAAPVLVLAFVPALAKLMPKPGAWMQTLKQVLAVPMYLSAIWLAWVLANQRGVDAFALVLVAATALALGLIWLEKLRFDDAFKQKVLAWTLTLSALVPLALAVRAPMASASQVHWQSYSEAALAQARSAGKPVLVNMTAAWCVTCKLNERVAMSGAEFAQLSQSTDTVLLKGDWTDQDVKITKYLQSFGASGVPLVVVYPRTGAQPVVLPQLLTPALIKEALEQAAK